MCCGMVTLNSSLEGRSISVREVVGGCVRSVVREETDELKIVPVFCLFYLFRGCHPGAVDSVY